MILMNNNDDDDKDTCQGLRHICLQQESKLCSPSRDLLGRAENDHIGDYSDHVGDHDDHMTNDHQYDHGDYAYC